MNKKQQKKKVVYSTKYAKGLRMTADMKRNPEKYKNRVVVAYDRYERSEPYMYVLIGNHDHDNEHDIRKIYGKTTNIPYLDTRVILYSTYIARHKGKNANG